MIVIIFDKDTELEQMMGACDDKVYFISQDEVSLEQYRVVSGTTNSKLIMECNLVDLRRKG